MKNGNNWLYQKKFMSKYEKPVWDALGNDKWKSTNQIRKEIEKKSGRLVNWFIVDKCLQKLHSENKIKRIQHDRIVLWKKPVME